MNVFILLMLLLVPTWAQGANLFTEDFESSLATLQAKYSCSYSSPAPFTDGAAQDWDTAQKFAGTYAMKQTYSGSQYDNPPRGGGHCEYDFSDQSQRDIWITWYHRLGTDWQTSGGGGVGGVGTKGLYMYMRSPSTGQVNGWVFHYFYGGNQLTLSAQGIKDHKGPNGPGTGTAIPYDTENMWQNVSSFEQPEGQWVCYEANFKLNTPGLADGQYLLYSTNMSTGGSTVLRASHTNREFIDSTTAGRMPSDARWFRFKYYRQDGSGDMWYDNSYVDTTRRGCSGTPPPSDTAAPSTPATPTVVSDTTDSITYTWTANSEDDLSHYVMQGCTPGACTNFATVGTVTKGTNTFTWTGRAANTLYRFRIVAVDTSNNASTASGIVDETTDAASVLPTVTGFTTTATGGTITYTGTPTDFRIAFGGTNGDGTFWSSQIIRTLAQVPGGALSFNWPAGTSYACAHARDAVAAEDLIEYRCNSVTPAAPGSTPTGTYLRKLSSNPRWLTLDGSTAIYRVGISGGTNCNASFCGLQDLERGDFSNLIPSTTLTHTFDGTTTDLGTLWTVLTTRLDIVGGIVQASAAGVSDNEELYTGVIDGNQFAQVTLNTFTGADFNRATLMVRYSDLASGGDGYKCFAQRNAGSTNTSAIVEFANGSGTNSAVETATTWAAGNMMRCRAVGKYIYLDRSTDSGVNWTNLLSTEDATYRTGYVGIGTNTTSLATNVKLDDFKAGPIVADYVTMLDAVVAEGGNWIRYWTLEQSGWCSDASCASNHFIRIPYTQFPWQWTGTTRTDTSTGTNIVVGVYDVTQLNQSFFDRVSARVDAALSRGITPIITMFSGGHLIYGTPPTWNAGFSNPFFSGNNVNGISCDTNANEACEEAHSLSNPNITNAQKAYINKLVQTIGNRAVILEVSNEDQSDTTLWQNMVMDQVRTAETLYGTDPHIIFQSGFTYGAFANSDHLFDNARNDAVSPLCTSDGTDWDLNPPANDGTKLIFYDSDHTGYADSCGTWTSIVPWKLFTRAIYPIYLSERESGAVQTAIKTAMAQTNLYSTKINLATAYPETGTSIFSTGYGLFTGTNSTTPNCGDYLMLMPSDGSSTINLTACGVGNTFTIEYLNLTSGAVTSGGTVNGGASRSFNPSGSDPMVVLLKSFAVADATAPTVSGGSPTGVLASGTTSVSMIVITDENATCKYGTVASTAYGSIASTFTTTGGTTHSQTISGLTDGATPTYYVRCQDVAGNANGSDYTVTWSITALAPDVAPPIRTAGSPSGVLIHTTASVAMTLTTDETATCKYGTIAGTAYASIASTFTTTASTSHSQTLNVTAGTTYTYYVRCTDGTNPNLSDYVVTWQVAPSPDVTAPILSCVTSPAGVLPAGTTTVDITCTTNENATVKMDSDPDIAYASQDTTFGTTGTTAHSQSVGSLADGTSYTRYVRASDGTNATTTDYPVSWSVASAAVSVAPDDVTNVRGTLNEATGTILWQWDAASGADHYIIEISAGDVFLVAVESASAATFYQQGSLTSNSSYNARVKAVNTANQESVNWAQSVAVNTSLPPQMTGLADASPGVYSNTIVLTWTAPTNTSLVSAIERCTGAACTTFAYHGGGSTTGYTDSTVSASTTYCYRGKFSNPIFGGTSADWSSTVCATTRSVVDTGSGLTRPRTPLPYGVFRLPRN